MANQLRLLVHCYGRCIKNSRAGDRFRHSVIIFCNCRNFIRRKVCGFKLEIQLAAGHCADPMGELIALPRSPNWHKG